ncbi:uncharacterized protein UV8b_04505 [Ustilaginoidea virens]|uniref:Fatty acid hydroxylase domain-containing protein n=1 Tax=Ustilaginoidea virens TaxID=1159556 RepID=A0A063BRY7_USTVR|nr:uncharacterized protein UV8b_04505 [Ustilaginoidea virens]QUC20264.1 hypothetical protein UV8b_04505 [Ustilaginoidea virens]GAO19846.1 hypothetical protein UVI_02062920 [Ustilaginoidea virens]
MSTPNAKDSMKSTWRFADKNTWGLGHWVLHLMNAHPIDPDKPIPIHAKTDKIPYLTQKSQHAWVLTHACAPLLIHQAILNITGWQNLHYGLVFLLYFYAFQFILGHESRTIRRMGQKWGFLDGDAHQRDGIPDVGATKIMLSLVKGTAGRVAMTVYFSYDHFVQPLDVLSDWKWWAWLALEIGLYTVILDFWFYWYHRLMHDVGFLWKYHRTHHLTKHPNQLLTAYADEEQEFFDLVGIPFITYISLRAMGLPLGFYEWWICHQYIAYIEVAGHSGLRLHAAGLSTLYPILRYFDAEIVIEDHDLHHRKGWRKSHNYGKQTRLWDRVFGTCLERIESAPENVDYENQVHVPLL